MTRTFQRASISTAVFLLFLSQVGSANAVLSPVGTDPSGALSGLSASCGLVLPSASLPFSRRFLSQAFESLDGTSTDTAGREEISSFVQTFHDADVPSMGISLDLEYERYFLPDDQLLSTADFVELVETVDPLGILRLSYQLNNSTIVAIAAVIRREYNTGVIDSNFFPSVAGNPVAIENNDITEGYLQSSFGPFEFTFGRQKVHLGPSPVNSLMISQRIPFMDALDLKGYLGPLSMTLIISTLENRLASPDVTPDGAAYDFGKTVILCNTHYFEYDFGFLRLGIGGQYLAVRPQNAFHIADFFPVISWHQTNITPNNLSLVADFSIVPLRGLTIYGQGGLDDINLNFAGVNDSGVPNIPACLIGASWQSRLNEFLLTAWLETGYTHYLWGNFDDNAAMARAIYRMDTDGLRRIIPLTSPYGPGSLWAVASCTVATPWQIDAGMRMQYVGKNPLADLTGTPYAADSGIALALPSHWLQFALEFRWTPLSSFWLSAAPEVDARDGATWFGLTLAGGVTLGADVRLRGADRMKHQGP